MKSTLIFTHMPKAAGTSLVAAIRRQYKNPKTLDLGRHPVEKYVEEFKQLPLEERARVELIVGHYPFGLHELIPSECQYITMLRDPVERIVSHYYHVLQDPEHYAYDRGFSSDMSLLEYVESGVVEQEVNDGQTRFLAGMTFGEDLLSCALRNGEMHYAVVGITERFDESLILMKRTLGWGQPYYYRRHVNDIRPYRHEIDSRCIAAIEERNQLDTQLYDHFCRVLERRIVSQGGDFQRKLRMFQLLNGVYKQYFRVRMQTTRWKAQLSS